MFRVSIAKFGHVGRRLLLRYYELYQRLQLEYYVLGYAVAQLVEALRYKSEGRGFDSRWGHCNFSFT